MKRPLFAACTTLWLLTGMFAVLSAAVAAPPVLDKSVRGAILPDRLSLELRAIACDTTQAVIPDGSRIVSDRWVMNEGDDHLGYFAGLVRIVTPDGTTLAKGLLRGTAGLSGLSPEISACTAPGHLEGMLQAVPVPSTTGTDPATAMMDAAMQPPTLLLHFQATRIPQSTDSIYEGRLKGLFVTPPAPPAVVVKPSRLEFGNHEPIPAVVENHADRAIEAEDLKTDCTILWLQRYVEGVWKPVENCTLERLTQTVVIKPGESLAVTLPGIGADQPGREPGTYRLALEFRFRDATGQPVGDILTTYSPNFKIGTITPPPPPPTGVFVKPERLEYRTTEPIRGFVMNQADRAISAPPIFSYCTILSLQRRVGDQWVQEGNCAYFTEPDPVTIPAGTTHIVTLPPGTTTANHEPGVYRLVLVYRFIDPATGTAGEALRAFSPEFSVGVIEPPPGVVRVNPGRLTYRVNESIMASVTNGLTAPIQSHAWYSYCGLLQLYRQVDAGWKVVGPCMLTGGPTITIEPGKTYPVTLPPAGMSAPDREPGTYKLVLDYQVLDANGQLSDVHKAESPLFQIAAIEPPATLKIAPDKPAYEVKDTITAVLQNGPAPVRIWDMLTLCTIIQLQRETAAGWQPVGGCPLDRAPQPTLLQPGQALTVPLTPLEAWDPGRYRLAVTFETLDAAGNPIGAEQTIWSLPFPVGILPPPAPMLALMPDKEAYRVEEPVTAILKNGPARVRIFDMQSFCTIIQMQRVEGDQWVPVGECLLKRASMPVYLEPGQALTVQLPSDVATTPIAWKPGMYRLVVTFAPVDAAGNELGPDRTVATRPFAIGAPLPPPPTDGVALITDRTSYGLDGRITGLVTNGTRQPIRAFLDQSFCTILALERLDGAMWTSEAPCPYMGPAARPLDIPAGQSVRVQLPPDITQVPAWKEGTYRLRMPYMTVNASGEIGLPMLQAVSPRFHIGSSIMTIYPSVENTYPIFHQR